MATITGDHVRALARSDHAEAALAVFDGEVRIVPNPDEADGNLVYTKMDLFQEYGDEITDVEAEVLASALSAQLVD